ncbi:hypothetical protein H6P81_014522 [Aristolochia fimbriata]|uniref:DUF7722 domain-containing protein n=1 Tax=Aristolochia fimbriata TaxID=158543 RepID=A0AAV7EI30_ARIFI|nr:hypothetical protein H6P81_014522 [Aristolochia fimbriata]
MGKGGDLGSARRGVARVESGGCGQQQQQQQRQKQVKDESCSCFQMPLHYPRYTKADYETMPEWKLDCLLREYGLPLIGDVNEKRKFAMGAFLWPSW